MSGSLSRVGDSSLVQKKPQLLFEPNNICRLGGNKEAGFFMLNGIKASENQPVPAGLLKRNDVLLVVCDDSVSFFKVTGDMCLKRLDFLGDN